MRRHIKTLNAAALMLGLAGIASAAETSLLPLEPGTYVVSSFKPCQQAPLAAAVQFDGLSFSGPHASDCTSSILAHQDTTYQVATECRALGDGTPAKPVKLVESFRIASPTHFEKLGQGAQGEYERCPSFR